MGQSLANNRIVEFPSQSTYIQNGSALNWAVIRGQGVLNSIIVAGATAGTIGIYDGYAVTDIPIAVFDSTNALAIYKFDCIFNNGLSIVTSADTYLSCTFTTAKSYNPDVDSVAF